MSEQQIDVQYAVNRAGLPGPERISVWACAALPYRHAAELSVRVVDDTEMRELNRRFRQQDKTTNVLSFPYSVPGMPALLGDLVIDYVVVEREASEQRKSVEAHFAHIVVHGVLHLRGYDHVDDKEALLMEAKEREILAVLGFPDPYRDDANG